MNKYTNFASLLFNARTNAHIAHLQTTSYAQHVALNTFYDGVVDIADSFIESAQGTQGVLTGYTLGVLNSGDIVPFLEKQLAQILELRTQFTEGHLVQIIDDCVELYTTTLYKLKNLK